MTRTVLACCCILLALAGCKKGPPQPEPTRADIQDAARNYARTNLPILDRGITQTHLTDIYRYMQMDKDATGKWPANLDAVSDLQRDSPKAYQAVKDGSIVVFWGGNSSEGILAYEKTAPVAGHSVVNRRGQISVMQPDELQRALGQNKN